MQRLKPAPTGYALSCSGAKIQTNRKREAKHTNTVTQDVLCGKPQLGKKPREPTDSKQITMRRNTK